MAEEQLGKNRQSGALRGEKQHRAGLEGEEVSVGGVECDTEGIITTGERTTSLAWCSWCLVVEGGSQKAHH